MTTDERNAILAGALEAAGHPELAYAPVHECAGRIAFEAWHNTPIQPLAVGVECAYCGSLVSGVPKPFHTSVDLTITALNALGMAFSINQFEVWVWRRVWRKATGNSWGGELSGRGPTAIAEALGACAVAVLQKEGGK